MNKIFYVIHQELDITFHRKTYIVIAFIVPFLAVLILAGIQLIQNQSPGPAGAQTGAPAEFRMDIEGFVDNSGLIHIIPENLPDNHLVPYETEEQARQALASGEINAYYVIPADYLEKGKVFYVYPDDKALISDGQEWVIQWTLLFNLVAGNEEVADMIWNPIWDLEVTSVTSPDLPASSSGEDCSRPGFACHSNDLIRYIPLIFVVLLYFSLLISSNMLFNSVGNEKENRTIEVVLLSLHPHQLLAGKIIGLGIAGLLQTVVWLGAIILALKIGGQTLNLPANFSFPTGILGWSLIFFLGGYMLYASLMAGAGVLVSRLKEAGAVSFIVMTPLLAGYLVGLLATIAGFTNEWLPVTLSIIPFTAPVVMVMRMADGLVPAWQMVLSAVLTYLTAYFASRLAANLFRAQYLLSGQSFSIGRYLRALVNVQAK